MIDFSAQTKVSEEVYHSNHSVLTLQKNDMQSLIDIAKQTGRKRSRLCTHGDSSEMMQEMFIVHPKGAYVRPHKHIGKPESMIIIEGEVDFIVFNEDGEIEQVTSMGSYTSGKPFYNTLRNPVYHTLIIRTDWLIFQEITIGPFQREKTIFASWSPEEKNGEEVKKYMEKLEKKVKK